MQENILSINTTYSSIDAFGRAIFNETLLSRSMEFTAGADPFQDLLWNASCSNQHC